MPPASKPDTESLDAALKLMTPVISHEIRNPMAVIGNSSYFIKTKLERLGTRDEKIERHLGIIESEIRRANGILEEIIGYTRMKEADPKTVPLDGLVESALADLTLPEGLALTVKAAGKEARVSVDPDLAVRALRHVIRNARDAAVPSETVPAGAGVSIVSLSASKGFCAVAVEDSGPGVPDSIREDIFVPFHTTKPRGVGLGLAYSRKALARQGARIEWSSPKGKGATFTLFFKAAQ